MVMATLLEQLGDLVEGETDPLRGLDHAQHGHRPCRIDPMPAEAAFRLGQQAAARVVAEGLQVHASRCGDLPAAQPGNHAAAPGAAAARTASAFSTATCPAGTSTSTCNSSPTGVTVNPKNQQHSLSRAIMIKYRMARPAVLPSRWPISVPSTRSPERISTACTITATSPHRARRVGVEPGYLQFRSEADAQARDRCVSPAIVEASPLSQRPQRRAAF